MKNLNITFTDKDFWKIKRFKKAFTKLSWEHFIMHCVIVAENAEMEK